MRRFQMAPIFGAIFFAHFGRSRDRRASNSQPADLKLLIGVVHNLQTPATE
jgi:hypothetical protein